MKSFSRASSGVSRICCLSQYLSLDLEAAIFRPSEQLVWVAFDPTLNLIFAGLSTTVSCVCLSVCQCLIPNLRSRINKIFQTGGCVSFILSVISKNHVFLVICYEQRGLDSKAHKHSATFKGVSPGAVISPSVSLYLQSLVVNNFKNYVGTNNMRHHLYSLLWGFVDVIDVLFFVDYFVSHCTTGCPFFWVFYTFLLPFLHWFLHYLRYVSCLNLRHIGNLFSSS